MNEIIISNQSSGWMAQYVGPHAREIMRLFGTATLPTAFTSSALAHDVLADVRRLNPNVTVTVHVATVLP